MAALRLDSVLAVGFSISRSKAAQLISAGRCAVNWEDTSKSDFAPGGGRDLLPGLGKCAGSPRWGPEPEGPDQHHRGAVSVNGSK